MVHSDVVSIGAVLYTCLPWLLSKYNRNIENCSYLHVFAFNFSSIFFRGSADPICPYVRTPMHPVYTFLPRTSFPKWSKLVNRTKESVSGQVCDAVVCRDAGRGVHRSADWAGTGLRATTYHSALPSPVTRATPLHWSIAYLLVHSVRSTGVLMFYLCYSFLYFFSSLVLRSHNQQMGGSWVCYEQLGVWCNFNISWFGFFASSPYFRGDGEIAPNLPKLWLCPHSSTCRNQTTIMCSCRPGVTFENGKMFFRKRNNDKF